jgi:hypothetical protein
MFYRVKVRGRFFVLHFTKLPKVLPTKSKNSFLQRLVRQISEDFKKELRFQVRAFFISS